MENILDYGQLDPGIRRAVRWFRELGHNTTDSGDGRTKGEDGLPIPYVFIVAEKIPTIKYLRVLRKAAWEEFGSEDIQVGCSFAPDEPCIISCTGEGLYHENHS